MILFLISLFVLSSAYIEIPLTRLHDNSTTSFNILVNIKEYAYTLSINLDDTGQFIKPFKALTKSKGKKQIKNKNQQYVYGALDVKSVEIDSIEGWKRYFKEALFLSNERFQHLLQLELDWLKIKQSNNTLNNGTFQLSPNLPKNKFYIEIKKNTPFISSDIFSIYISANEKQNRLQLGGYDTNLAINHGGQKFKKIPLTQNKSIWELKSTKTILGKQQSNKWHEYILSSQADVISLNISSNFLTLRPQITKILTNSLESQSISCNFTQQLQCQNITSLELSLHMVAFVFDLDNTINITLYRLLSRCQDKKKMCWFNIKEGNQTQIGGFLFSDYYPVFDMQNHTLMLATVNKYPHSWFNSVYVFRFFIAVFLMMIIGAIAIAFPEMYVSYQSWMKRRSGLEGIELVSSNRENTKIELELE